MTIAAVSLGSNVGDRRQHLLEARLALQDLGTVVAVSPVYRTAPVGVEAHPEYLNAVALVDTDLSARQMLRGLLAIEQKAGRVRGDAPLPRTIDLDLVLFGHEHHDDDGLIVPHPRMLERRFVLEPLADVWPKAPVPGSLPLADALAAVRDQELAPADRGSWWVGVQALLAVHDQAELDHAEDKHHEKGQDERELDHASAPRVAFRRVHSPLSCHRRLPR